MSILTKQQISKNKKTLKKFNIKILEDAPIGTPENVKFWMSIVETVKKDTRFIHMPFTEQLKIAQVIYSELEK